ncbi:GNAT family N-acetyltransferase [Candidatus Woesearchaeota archaeon]|nr:GNAT family N-acetyltransferase [Candidatus Woesearchaeota archaeon]
MRLTTERLVIREIRKSDVKDIVRNANNLNVSRYLLRVPYPYRKKDGEWWVGLCQKDSKKKPRIDYQFAIELKSEKRLIGAISLMHVDRFQGTAEIGFWLGEGYWRQGIMSEAIRVVLEIGFEKLKLRRINWNAFAENKGSNALAKKFSFKFEGVKRKDVRSKATGKIHDHNLCGLLFEDWKRKR